MLRPLAELAAELVLRTDRLQPVGVGANRDLGGGHSEMLFQRWSVSLWWTPTGDSACVNCSVMAQLMNLGRWHSTDSIGQEAGVGCTLVQAGVVSKEAQQICCNVQAGA